MSSDSEKEEEGEEQEEPCSPYITAGGQEGEAKMSNDRFNSLDSSMKEVLGARQPRRRWSRSTGSEEDGVLMVKSMLDLRLLDSYCPDRQEENQSEQEAMKTGPLDVCSQKGRGPDMEAGLPRPNQELGSTISLQVSTPWVETHNLSNLKVEGHEARTNQRPDFIWLSGQDKPPDGGDLVIYPEQWEDRVSLAESEFQVKEACPGAVEGQRDKPSPDSGCSLGFNSSLSSPGRPIGDDSTEPLSVDGNSSDMEEDEEEGGSGEKVASQLIPHTPDQEAFLKEHFVTLADLSSSGSPSRVSHSSSESLSISSRFLSQNSAGSRSVPPFPTRTSGEVKARPLVSEVRPLMEENQNQTNDKRVFFNQDITQKQNQKLFLQDQVESQNRTNQGQLQPLQAENHSQQGRDDEEETSSAQQVHRPSPLKKKVQTASESRRNLGPTARAATSHLSSTSSGLRKVQSVQSLLSDTGDSSFSQSASRPSREVSPQLLLPLQRPTTLPSSPRRPTSTAPPAARPSSTSARSPQQETAAALSAANTPRKSSSSSTPLVPRSYMSPTASSMAKISRSVSMGEGLQFSEHVEEPSVTSSSTSQVKETLSSLVIGVPSSAPPPMPPQATVVPVVVTSSSSSSVGNLGNQAPPRSLQARVPGSNRPLPDKPSLASFSPSPATLTSVSRPLPVSVSPMASKVEVPRTPADRMNDTGLDSPPSPLHPFILSSLHWGSASSFMQNDQPISVETCRTLTNELQSCFKKALHLYRQVSASSSDDSSSDQCQMAVVLSEAFQAMRAELDCLPLGAPSILGGEESKTAALLEEYSLLLLQAVNRRLNTHNSE